jgi:hypothetical protein
MRKVNRRQTQSDGKSSFEPSALVNKNFFENYQMDTPTTFEYNWSSGFSKILRTTKMDGHQVMIIPHITLKGLIFIQAHPYQYNTTQTKVCRPARCMSELFSQLSI